MSTVGASYRLSLINGFELRRGDAVLSLPPGCQRLIAFLALCERPVLRSFVSGSLWSDSDIDHANACLRSTLWRLLTHHMPEIVVATQTHMSLAENVIVDYRETMTWARTVLAGSAASLHPAWTIGEIGALGGEVLPDWYDEWVLLTRERFRQLCMHALESLCDQLAQAGRYGEALLAGLSAVAIEPLRESAHRRVVAVHLLESNYVEALRQYRSYERLLRDELSLQPSAELSEMLGPALRLAIA